MKKETTITPTYREIKPGEWRYGIDIQPLRGKRKRHIFNSKKERDEEMELLLDQRREYGEMWMSLDARQRAEIGFLLREAQEAGFTLRQAVEFFKAGGAPGSSVKLGVAYKDFISEKEKMRLRPKTMQALKSNIGRFMLGREAMSVAQIRRDDIVKYLERPEWGPRTYNSYLTSLTTFFNWCVDTEKIAKSPTSTVANIGKKQMPDLDTPPAILDLSQCRRLLVATLELDPKLAPYLALGLFAGLRPERECGKFVWDDIENDGTLLVRGLHAKDGQRRHVDVHPTLKAWLDMGGDLPPTNLRNRMERVKARAGLIKLSKVKGEDRCLIEWTGWAQDCLRHTFASHYLPLHGPEKTIGQMGHGDYSMLFTHYRKLISKTDAEKFWEQLHPARLISGLFDLQPVVVEGNTNNVTEKTGGTPMAETGDGTEPSGQGDAVHEPESEPEANTNPEPGTHRALQWEPQCANA